MVSTLIICSEGLLTYLRIEARSRGIDRPITSVPLLPTSPGRGRAETTHPADQRAAWRDPQIARTTRRKISGIAGSQTRTTGAKALLFWWIPPRGVHTKLVLFARYSKTSCPARRWTRGVRWLEPGGCKFICTYIPVITDYTFFTTTTATTVTTVPCLASCCGMVVQISLSEV